MLSTSGFFSMAAMLIHCPSTNGTFEIAHRGGSAPRQSHVGATRRLTALRLVMAFVERLRPRCVIRRIDDFHDFRSDPFHHDFESLPQRRLRGRASLAAAA